VTGGEVQEVVEGGEPVRAWPDDVSGLVKELADVTDALVDRLGPALNRAAIAT
jgi:hypothetical protein